MSKIPAIGPLFKIGIALEIIPLAFLLSVHNKSFPTSAVAQGQGPVREINSQHIQQTMLCSPRAVPVRLYRLPDQPTPPSWLRMSSRISQNGTMPSSDNLEFQHQLGENSREFQTPSSILKQSVHTNVQCIGTVVSIKKILNKTPVL